MWKVGWEGHLKQYTEARTFGASPVANEGMYFKDWSAQFDYFHHEEGHSAFVHSALCEPEDPETARRARTYAALYTGDDPDLEIQNYDKEKRLMRSLFTGSRGPLLRKATGLDWAGDPLVLPTDGGYGFRVPGEGGRVVDVPELLAARGEFAVGHGEENYDQMIRHFEEYTDIVGDHPLNIGTTTQVLLAYMLTGEEQFAAHVVDYIDAWCERTAANGGIIPSNVGLNGTIGGECDGQWWGGAYGWGFNCANPVTGVRVWRSVASRRTAYGFGNALLLTGRREYVEVWRGVVDAVNANARKNPETGQIEYPRCYGAFPGDEPSWNNWNETPFNDGVEQLYFWTQDERDLRWASPSPWRDDFLSQPLDVPLRDVYAEGLLEAGLSTLQSKLDRMRSDPTDPVTRLSDDINAINPANGGVDPLIQLMCGGLPMGKNGCLLHVALRYFDPQLQRAGLPPGVSALLEAMDAQTTTVFLANLTEDETTVIVQAGAYAEHTITSVAVDGSPAVSVDSGGGTGGMLGKAAVAIALAAGSGARVVLGVERYSNRPTVAFPWAAQLAAAAGPAASL
eukprot:COSAG06_NODE_278_length_18546_cov_7.134981_17_plen_567_part_00